MFGDMSLPAIFLIAFVIVLALIGVFAWLRFRAGGLSTSSARGRQARLGVIEAAAVDGRRRLLLVRRDNVEHLIMVGGPADLLVEANIVRAQSVATREGAAARPPEPGWQAPADNGLWPAPAEPAARPGRAPGERPSVAAPVSDEPPLQLPPEPAPRVPVGERSPGYAPEPPRSGMRVEPHAPRMPEAPRAPAEARRPLAAPPRAADEGLAGDRHLAEMAMQLEAALRRSGPSAPPREGAEPPLRRQTEPRFAPSEPREPRSSLVERARQSRASTFTPSRSRPATPPPPPPPPAPPAEPAADAAQAAAEPDVSAPAPSAEPPVEAAPHQSEPDAAGAAAEAPEGAKASSLEEEMANLLGRAPGKP